MEYPHLGLRDWPFRIVPDPAFCDFLADRTTLKKDIDVLLQSLENRPTSDIQLIWSWYGAGKTHTLFFLANECASKHIGLLPVYTELPREAKGFVDLYRSTVAQLQVESIVDAFLEFTTRPAQRTAFGQGLDPDLASALTQAAVGDRPIQVLLSQWLLGNSLPQASLRELGVGSRLNTTEKCATVLADAIRLLAPQQSGATGRRLIWIVDEVQRVEDLPPSGQRSILSGLVGVFNRCPVGLTLIMSYTGTPKEIGLPEWIPEDLKDRIGLERPMLLPPLGPADAQLLIKELLAHFRIPSGLAREPLFPFEPDAIQTLISVLARANELKPRAIMETLDASLRFLEPELRAGSIKTIDVVALKRSLTRFALDWSEPATATKGRRGK